MLFFGGGGGGVCGGFYFFYYLLFLLWFFKYNFVIRSHYYYFTILSLSFFCQVAFPVKISNILICFCSIELSYPIFEKKKILSKMYILYCIIK